ncbi:MAG: reverse transcriptase domain-containing protein, partial [Verrucomicrobia bacterium]|nr:reverse transcriptase domain-containing protein [Verrucomicrobiota bacterium]
GVPMPWSSALPCSPRKVAPPWVPEGDIRACFDEISHSWLRQNVPRDKPLLARWLQAGYWEKGQRFPTSKGTPQGGLISPLLAKRRVRKTARTVVWEGAGAQTPAPDPIGFAGS